MLEKLINFVLQTVYLSNNYFYYVGLMYLFIFLFMTVK